MRGSNSVTVAGIELKEYNNDPTSFTGDYEGFIAIPASNNKIITTSKRFLKPLNHNNKSLLQIGTYIRNDMGITNIPVYMSENTIAWVEHTYDSNGKLVPFLKTAKQLHEEYLNGEGIPFFE